MNFQTYVENCIKFLQDNPGFGKFEVISACDEEGNGYSNVIFGPTLYWRDGGNYQDVNLKWVAEKASSEVEYCWQCEEKAEEFNKDTHECYECYEDNLLQANLVCIN